MKKIQGISAAVYKMMIIILHQVLFYYLLYGPLSAQIRFCLKGNLILKFGGSSIFY